MFFHGVLAVGTEEGHLYVIDLALDAPINSEDDPYLSTEDNPSSLQFIEDNSANTNLADLRLRCLRNGQHLAIWINRNAFGYMNRKTFHHKASGTGTN